MILSLLTYAFAGGPAATATFESETIGDRKNVDGAVHLGLDLRGINPGLGARFDLGHRVSVDGIVFAGAPTADRVQWTGGVSLGFEIAAVKIQLGTHGSLDFGLGLGGMLTGSGLAKLEGGPFDVAEWASGTLQISPNGMWSVYAGVLGSDFSSTDAEVVPTAGVRFRLD